jgi:hypothetical protein
MTEKTRGLITGAVILAMIVGAAVKTRDVYRFTARDVHRYTQLVDLRTKLYAAIRPVRLANCVPKRFGHPHDGGYLLCENLAGEARSAYSWGIAGRDEWGCDIARAYHLPVHQYDCFDPRRPVCDGATFHFNDECVGAGPARILRWSRAVTPEAAVGRTYALTSEPSLITPRKLPE